MFDTHTHLIYFDNIEEITTNSKLEGLTGLISCATNFSNWEENITLSKVYPEFVYSTLGIHPEDADLVNSTDLLIQTFEKYYSKYSESIIAIGECGLDYYHRVDNIIKQSEILDVQLSLAEKYKLPLIIHTRNSLDLSFQNCITDTISLSKKYKVIGVCHCFTGTITQAELLLSNGFYLGFTNIITYPKNIELFETAKYLSEHYPDRVLLETDSPYLPPVHKRGQKCNPSDVKFVYNALENYISSDIIRNNVRNLFKI